MGFSQHSSYHSKYNGHQSIIDSCRRFASSGHTHTIRICYGSFLNDRRPVFANPDDRIWRQPVGSVGSQWLPTYEIFDNWYRTPETATVAGRTGVPSQIDLTLNLAETRYDQIQIIIFFLLGHRWIKGVWPTVNFQREINTKITS